MSRALQESIKGRMTSFPDPWVGCVIVKHGEVIATGHHQGGDRPHAEKQALAEAGEEAKGSTVYVTVEPCVREGDGSCAEALIASGVRKVVIGIPDPDPKVRGTGIARLRQAGIEVETGLSEQEIKTSLTPYLHHRETGLPFCVLKAAISMDGKIAAKNGSSLWITGEQARRDIHKIRARSQAILIGTRTAAEDKPALTVRHVSYEGMIPPLRVVLDAVGKIPPEGPLFDVSLAPTLVVTTDLADPEAIRKWEDKGCETVFMPYDPESKNIDLKALLKYLGERGVFQVLVEGGATLFTNLINKRLVNRLILYMGGCLLGAEGVSLFSDLKLERIDDAIRMHLVDLTRFGKDVRLDYVF